MTAETAEQVFVARQPILSANQRVAAYELLFRRHSSSTGAVIDVPLRATSEVLNRSLLTIGLDELTGGKPGFVNFPREALFSEVTEHLPPQLVIEVLEDVSADDDVIAACADLRRRGYRIALDDYYFEPEREPFLAVCDIVKFDLTLIDLGAPGLGERLQQLRRRGVQLLAEKVETTAEFALASSLGFELFQGYFWGRPEIVGGRQLPPSARSYMRLLSELGQADFDLEAAKELVKSDPALSQALLRYINSAQFRWMKTIDSVHRAMMMLGRDAGADQHLRRVVARTGDDSGRARPVL
jgi:EAL and modified HD-GYP domain-containing signal transduction protein